LNNFLEYLIQHSLKSGGTKDHFRIYCGHYVGSCFFGQYLIEGYDGGLKISWNSKEKHITIFLALFPQSCSNLHPEHLSSPLVFSGVHVSPSLVLCVCFVDCCLSFCPSSFGHCIVCPSLICGFWLPLWYLQTQVMAIAHIAFGKVS
jgi:hypothetical protein